MENLHVRGEPAEPAPHEGLSAFCPRFQFAAELVGRRWVAAILRALFPGPARFNELLSAIPELSDRLLTERLRELEHHGIVTRRVDPGRPVRVTYELTACGRSLEAVIEALSEWSERWVDVGNASR